jgi:hypothetical protein
MSTTPAWDPSQVFTGVDTQLLADVKNGAPIFIPVFVGLLGLGIITKLIRRGAKG